MSPSSNPITAVLRELTGSDNPTLALLADVLTQPENDIAATLSSATSQVINGGVGPTQLIATLLEIDGRLLRAGATQEPVAMKWAPLVAERAVHAEQERCRETLDLALARSAPIFVGERGVLFAVPAAPLEFEGFALFANRLLSRALNAKPKRVVLVLAEDTQRDEKVKEACDDLVRDLEEQKIGVRVCFL